MRLGLVSAFAKGIAFEFRYMHALNHSSFIPEGNQVINHTYTLQRNPRFFSPWLESFWSDRWLPKQDRHKIPSNEWFILDLSTAFNPFSCGPRQEPRSIGNASYCMFYRSKIQIHDQGVSEWEFLGKGIEVFFCSERPILARDRSGLTGEFIRSDTVMCHQLYIMNQKSD
jgi:Cytochrome P450